MTDPTPAKPTSLADPTSGPAIPATITESLPCLGCDYDLRGLDATRTCPECGKAVGESMFTNDEKRVLAKHAEGLKSLAVSVGLTLGAPLTLFAAPVLGGGVMLPFGLAVFFEHLYWIGAVKVLGGAPTTRQDVADGMIKSEDAGSVLGVLNLLALGFVPLSMMLFASKEGTAAIAVFSTPVAFLTRYLAARHAAAGATRFARFVGSPSFIATTRLPVWWTRVCLLCLTIGSFGLCAGIYLTEINRVSDEFTKMLFGSVGRICSGIAGVSFVGSYIGAIITLVYAIRARRRILGWVGRPAR